MKLMLAEEKQRRDKKRKTIIFATAVVFVVLAVVAFALYVLIGTGTEEHAADFPAQITVTVAWNNGSIADMLARQMDFGETQTALQNIAGTHGTQGLNAVFNAPHSGENLLSTSLSAFHQAHEMGFADSSPDDWAWWLVAYSPEHDDYFGFFTPAAVPQNIQNGLNNLIRTAAEKEEFLTFLEQNGLSKVNKNV